MVLGDLDSYVQKNETQSPTYTIHKNKFKVDKRLKYYVSILTNCHCKEGKEPLGYGKK